MMQRSYITIANFSETFGVSKSTQWRMRRDGRLQFFRIGRGIRYRLDEVLQAFGLL